MKLLTKKANSSVIYFQFRIISFTAVSIDTRYQIWSFKLIFIFDCPLSKFEIIFTYFVLLFKHTVNTSVWLFKNDFHSDFKNFYLISNLTILLLYYLKLFKPTRAQSKCIERKSLQVNVHCKSLCFHVMQKTIEELKSLCLYVDFDSCSFFDSWTLQSTIQNFSCLRTLLHEI